MVQTPTPRNNSPRLFQPTVAWSHAMAMLRANREIMLALAGAFFLIPQLLINFVLPQPESGLEGEAALDAMMAMYADWWPIIVIALIVQGIGFLAVIALLTARDRPTVGDALGRGVRLLLTYIAAQLMIAAGVGAGMLLILVPFAASGNEALAGVALIPAFAFMIWIFVRTALCAPVIVAEGQCNPFEALKRTWVLMRGQTGRFLVFALLILVVAFVIYIVATVVPGALLAAIAGRDTAEIVVAVASALVAAGYGLVMAAVLTATYRMLAKV